MNELIEQQYDHLVRWNGWANGLVFDALRASEGGPVLALAAFQHALETEVTWLRRIEAAGEPNPPLWGTPSLGQCEEYAGESRERITRVHRNLNATYLGGTVSYSNSRGDIFTDNIADMLLHMFLHSMQYRGEAAALLNNSGYQVPDFDFIFWRRMGGPT